SDKATPETVDESVKEQIIASQDVDAAQDVEASKDLSNPTDAAQDVEASKDLSSPNDAALTESFGSSSESKASTEKEDTPDLVA
ncbi:hypothetical protein A2U01_0088338, partial [Trifolium medium]|nr:hypothetical protein [Trifolium medium]